LAIVLVGGAVLSAAAFGIHRWQRQKQARESLTQGLDAYQRGDWETARMMLGRYLSRYPENVDVLRKYAEAQLSTRPLPPANILQAAGAYRRLLRLQPRDDAAFDRLAIIYESTGDAGELGQIAASRLAELPGDPRATLAQAKQLLARQKPREALQTLDTLLAVQSPSSDDKPILVEACILAGIGEAQVEGPDAAARALRRLDRALEIDGTAPMALVRRAAVKRELASQPGAAQDRLMAEARADLEKAAAVSAGNSDPRVLLALSEEWMAHGRFDLATAQLAAADRLDDRAVGSRFVDPDAWTASKFALRAKLIRLSGDAAQASALADDMLAKLEKSPQRLMILPLAVELLLQANRTADARQRFDEYQNWVKTLPPGVIAPDATVLLEALVARAEDKSYRVIELLMPIVGKPNAPPIAAALLSDAFEQTGQGRRAMGLATVSSSGQPVSPFVGRMASRSALAQGRWAEALAILDSVPAAAKGDVEWKVQHLTAEFGQALEHKSGDQVLAKLAAELETLKNQNPKRPDIRLLLASIAQARNQNEAAEAELKAAAEACNETPQALLALARFQALSDKPQQAEQQLKIATQRFADQAIPWMILSQFQLGRNSLKDADATLKQGLTACKDPAGRRQIELLLATTQVTHGDRKAGVDGLQRLAVAAPNDVESRVLLLEIPDVLSDASRADPLIADLRRIEGETGLRWRLCQARQWLSGTAWSDKSREATALLTYCIDADPRWPAPVLALGELYERVGDQANAEATYVSGLAKTDDDAVANRLLELFRRQRRFNDGYALIQQMERRLGERVARSKRLALALDEGKFDTAMAELQLRTSGEKAAPGDLLALATVTYAAKHDVDQAMRLLDQAAKAGADAVAVARVRVQILVNADRKDDALAILNTLVEESPSVDAYLARGSYLQYLKQTDAAEKDFRRLAEASKDDKGPAMLGEFLAQNDRMDDAIDVWEKGLAAFPNSTMLKRGLAKAHFVRSKPGDAERVKSLLQDLAKSDPNDIEILQLRVMDGMRTGSDESLDAARRAIHRAVLAKGGNAATYRDLVARAMALGDLESARTLAAKGLQISPGDSILLIQQAEMAAAQGDEATARSLVRSVLAADPKSVRAWEIDVSLAMRAQDREYLKKAAATLETLQRAAPDEEAWPNLRADALMASGDPAAAIEELSAFRQTKAGRTSLSAALHAEALHRMRDDWPAARAVLGEAVAIAPDDIAVRRISLLHLAHEKKFDDIVALCEKPPADPAKAAELLIVAAPLLNESPPHRSRALEFARRAVELQPRDTPTQLTLGLLAYSQGDVQLAEKAYRAALKLDPTQPDALNNLAWILAHDRNQNDEAWRLARQAVDQRPTDPELRDTLAFTLKRLGRASEAADEYRACIKLSQPGSPTRAKAMAQLALLSRAAKDTQALAAYASELQSIAGHPDRLGLTPAEVAELQEVARSLKTSN